VSPVNVRASRFGVTARMADQPQAGPAVAFVAWFYPGRRSVIARVLTEHYAQGRVVGTGASVTSRCLSGGTSLCRPV
jgi:hypothetical protein